MRLRTEDIEKVFNQVRGARHLSRVLNHRHKKENRPDGSTADTEYALTDLIDEIRESVAALAAHAEQQFDSILSNSVDASAPKQESVKCPSCGTDYSHIREVFTRMGSDPNEARIYAGTRAKGTTDERRSALVIVFDGECEHAWEWEIQQHKGNNLFSARLVPPKPYGETE